MKTNIIAEDVNPEVAGDGKTFGPQKTGQYIGWVRFDSFEAKYAEVIWRTNFSDALQYCTVTVNSGMDDPDYPEQTYRVLKGTSITIPGNIYKKLTTGKNIGGWTAEGATVDTLCAVGETFKVSEDVTFTAKWLEKGQIPVRLEWKDGENADQLRENSVQLNVTAEGGAETLTLSADQSWQGIVTVEGDVTDIVPDWEKIAVTEDHPLGQDTEGQYRYESVYEAGNGYVLTFTHTPQAKTSVAGMIVWDDEGYEDQRPSGVTVHLQKNGSDTGQSATVTAANDWQFDFTDLARYENGEEIKYSITEEDVDDYTALIDGYTVTNSYVVDDNNTDEAVGIVSWNDSDNAGGVRPESVTLHLMNNGETVASQEVEAGELGLWSFNFGRIPFDDRENYTLTADNADGYTVTVENASPAFSVTYTLIVDGDEKDPAELQEAPAALDLTYTGEPQTLIEEGNASGGWLMYALGSDDTAAPDAAAYSALLPAGTDVGTYYVWYYVKGDALHTDTEPQRLTVSIAKKYFMKHSLSLNGDIGVNFYLHLSDEEKAASEVIFTWNGNSAQPKTLTVPYSQAKDTENGVRFTCPISAAEMNDTLTAKLYIGGELMDTDTYSARQYADVILYDSDWIASYKAKESESKYNDLATLIKTMLNYGAYAQTQFDHNTEYPANTGIDYPLDALTADELSAISGILPKTADYDLSAYGLSYYGSSLLLKTKTTLRFYFEITDPEKYNAENIRLGDITQVKPYKDGSKYVYIEAVGIAANDLDQKFILSVGETVLGEYSALSYVKDVLTDGITGEPLTDTVTALYRFHKAAKAFFAVPVPGPDETDIRGGN